MIKFSVDYYDTNTFFKSLDYSNKVILNAVADPLFIYDKEKEKYIPNACQEYTNYRNKKYTFIIRDDLYFSNGEKVLSLDYVEAIKRAKNGIFNEYFKNIDSIKASDNTIEIALNQKDDEFINKLSIYTITPVRNGVYSGRFQLTEKDNQLIFKVNDFYRCKSDEDLFFIKIDDLDNNIKMFNNNEVDITNNTLIPLSNNNINNEYSNIIYSIELSTKIAKKDRKDLIRSINKKSLIDDMGNGYFVKDDFFCMSKSVYKNKCNFKNNMVKKLTLCYSSFYPNPQVARKLKYLLEQANYEIELIECDYEELKNQRTSNADIKLVLNYFEYNSDYYFYQNKYFQYIMRKNILYNWCLKHKKMKKLMNKLFKNKYIKEPLISFYSNYLTNDKTSNFSYLECDYKKISNNRKK